MEVKFLRDEKGEAEIELDNLTVAEILRAYLVRDEQVEFAAWKREHSNKNPILKIKTKGKSVKKAIEDAISHIGKEADKIASEFKKAK